MGILRRMAWQDYLTDDEREELAQADARFALAEAAFKPEKDARDAVRRKLKIRCDMRAHRAREGSDG